MDITTLFKACVKTVRTTNKSLGVKDQKNVIFKTTSKDVNLTKAREIIKQITSLQIFFLENKAAYLNVLNYLSSNKTMTEFDRAEVDTTAEKIVRTCSMLISTYKKEIEKLVKSKQKEEHYENIIDSLETYLRNVSKIYTEAKAIRVKRVIETHKLSKLESRINGENKSTAENTIENGKYVNIPNTVKDQPDTIVHTVNTPQNMDGELSAEEMQMFESENDVLYSELNNISDELREMETKVVHIAELQEMFTEKVLQQETDIERIATVVVGSTENMKDANEQIRQAIQRNAGLRVWVLFFLLIMSFSLLFLDWYND